jgi:hypothetical protein
MAREDEHRRDRRTLSGHPYPLLRVPSSDALLSALELQLSEIAIVSQMRSPTMSLSTATSWRLAENHADHRAVVADYIGDGFAGEALSVSAGDFDFDKSEPSNIISFATVARRWVRDGEEIFFVSDDDIACAFELFLPVVRDACRRVGVQCRVIYPKPQKTRPLARGVEQELVSFIRLANLTVLHPFD